LFMEIILNNKPNKGHLYGQVMVIRWRLAANEGAKQEDMRIGR